MTNHKLFLLQNHKCRRSLLVPGRNVLNENSIWKLLRIKTADDGKIFASVLYAISSHISMVCVWFPGKVTHIQDIFNRTIHATTTIDKKCSCLVTQWVLCDEISRKNHATIPGQLLKFSNTFLLFCFIESVFLRVFKKQAGAIFPWD